jgi:hypothetical protein
MRNSLRSPGRMSSSALVGIALFAVLFAVTSLLDPQTAHAAPGDLLYRFTSPAPYGDGFYGWSVAGMPGRAIVGAFQEAAVLKVKGFEEPVDANVGCFGPSR